MSILIFKLFKFNLMQNLEMYLPTKSLIATNISSYFEGKPRETRFDGQKGILKIKESLPISESGDKFTIIPLASRLFTSDGFLGRGLTNWLEVIYLNQKGEFCCTLFNGLSVKNYVRMERDMLHDNLTISKVALMCKPTFKSGKSGNQYYVANFSYVPLSENELLAANTIRETYKLYDSQTIDAPSYVHFSENYHDKLLVKVA